MKKAGRIMLAVCAGLFVLIAVPAGVLILLSPGKVKPVLDKNGNEIIGSISEKIHVRINGVEQGMFIKSSNASNPVLLVIHGGPGCAEYALTRKHPTGLENNFTVCWWEQRGTGLSWSKDITDESMTVDQIVSDAIGVTNYLRARFGQDKIYLLGHSWGSIVGITAAQKAPELYHAYIGMSQISRQLDSEKLAYSWMLKWYAEKGDDRVVRLLMKTPITGMAALPREYLAIRDYVMHKAGIGTMHDMKSIVTGYIIPVFTCPEYTLGEKINFMKGIKFSSSTGMKKKVWTMDMTRTVTKLEIPTYFFSGIYDYTVAYPLSKQYLEMLDAPVKGFYTFSNSAHSPVFEEPERANRILVEDVLHGTTNLADR
jgi:pimeloyl-ACP methyl ester carboxylesterase